MSVLAEKNLIGAILINESSLDQVYGICEPDMFIDRMAKEIFRGMLVLHDSSRNINQITLAQECESIEYPKEDIAGFLKECVKDLVVSTGSVDYANNILNEYKVREVKNLFNWHEVDLKASNVDERIGVVISTLENLVDKKKSGLVPMKEIVKEQAPKHFTDNVKEKLKTGFDKLDLCLGGLEGSDICVIAARPSVGKTAFIEQVMNTLADSGKKNIAFYSMEMSRQQLYERTLSYYSGIGLQRVRNAKAYLNDEEKIVKAANEVMSAMTMDIDADGRRSAGEIKAECRHRKLDAIVVDYLQLVKSDGFAPTRQQEIGNILKVFKDIAKEKDIPIILLCQLNRAVEQRTDKEPMMSDLREAGDIEQDASVIIMMWNLSEDGQYKGLKVEKNRQGTKMKEALEFNGSLMKFIESDKQIKTLKGMKKLDDECPF